jgi:anti-sigma regulatory factor (Ser/Thr protein kinase)
MPPLLCSGNLAAAIMHATNPSINSTGPSPEARLTLESRLEDLALVWPWAEALAARYSVPANTLFAIQLCLEEALSNIMRHGYQGQLRQSITIACAPCGIAELVFTIEDDAPPFDPFAVTPAAAPASLQDLEPGGQGIRLIQKFANRHDYQQLPNGNRLTLAFVIPAATNP